MTKVFEEDFKGTVLRYVKVLWVPFFVVAAALFLDLLTKYLIESTMALESTREVIPNFLNFHFTLNDGAAFGIFSGGGARIFFIAITVPTIMLLCYLVFRFRAKSRFLLVAFALMIGGAAGNLVDRIDTGKVRDFIQFVYLGKTIFGQKSFAIFNIADAALVVGEIMLVVYFLFMYVDPKNAKAVAKRDAKLAKKQTILDKKIAANVQSVNDYLRENGLLDEEPDAGREVVKDDGRMKGNEDMKV